MKKVLGTENKPIKLWLDDIEESALDQAKNLANLPFLYKHVAIMPDSHFGYGMPIGGVIATEGVIIPNAVGVDIGCGMCSVKTSLTEIDKEVLKKIMGEIRNKIPVGFSRQDKEQSHSLMPDNTDNLRFKIIEEQYESALKQLGTLGSGNHFCEVQKGDDGYIWIMIHSGSRNLGYRVANHYNEIAKDLNEKYYSSVPKKHDLAFLPINTTEFDNYRNEMNYCVDFAFANRSLMMERVKESFLSFIECSFESIINIAHNYATMENHFGKNVMIHRKGATRARKDEIGIVPGSQGTKSYIVRGLGNCQSFMSCSHGAGRTMSRKRAKIDLNLADEIRILDDLGVIHGIRNTSDLDEAPSAYKDIDVVMENQNDLVEIVTELIPLAVIKG